MHTNMKLSKHLPEPHARSKRMAQSISTKFFWQGLTFSLSQWQSFAGTCLQSHSQILLITLGISKALTAVHKLIYFGKIQKSSIISIPGGSWAGMGKLYHRVTWEVLEGKYFLGLWLKSKYIRALCNATIWRWFSHTPDNHSFYLKCQLAYYPENNGIKVIVLFFKF